MNKVQIILTFFLHFASTGNAQIVLPFELIENKYILIKLPFQDSQDSLTFFFDTGASATLLDKNIAEQYHLKPNHSKNIRGAGGEKKYEVILNQKIALTDNEIIDSVNIVLEDLTTLRNSAENNFDGIIGNDIIKNYLTKIDFDAKKILLYKFNETIEMDGYTEIPFTFKNGISIPQFPISIELKNGKKFKGDVFFDSGAAGISLIVNTPFKEKNALDKKIGKTMAQSTTNLSTESFSVEALVKKVELGSFTFNNVPILLASDTVGVSSYDDYLGILGSKIINRFDIVLDYKHYKLYLRPNHLYNDVFEIPVSPIKLQLSNNEIVISEVVDNSTAYRKGLRIGQTIISINNITTKDIKIYREMLNQENKKVRIKYLDEKKQIKVVKMKLKKLI